MAYTQQQVTNEQLDFWIENGMNVLMAGLHGVGKTAQIKEAFERNGLCWRYFSAATMDPWTDFVGVPKEKVDENGKSTLQFVLPEDFADDKVEALFFDEFNRAPKKVRNAVMELMQFKSINGRKFENLKVIWAAVNPKDAEDMDFDVEEIDPAQEDRFHVHVEIPYKPSFAYFVQKYGEQTAKAACDWWDGLDDATQKLVSPRRLDYAIECFQSCGNMRFLLPREAATSALYNALSFGSPEVTFKKIMEENNEAKARQFLAHENNVSALKDLITEDPAVRKFALPLLSPERISSLLARNREIKQEIWQNPVPYAEIIRTLAAGSQNRKIKKECKELLVVIDQVGDNTNASDADMVPSKPLPSHCPKWEHKHFANNFEFRDEYDVIDSEDAGSFDGDLDTHLRATAQKTLMAKNSYYKGQCYNDAAQAISSDLNATQAMTALRILDWFVANSNIDTISSKTEIPVYFNTCVHAIRDADPSFDIATLSTTAPYFFYKFFSEKANSPSKKFVDKLIIKPKAKSEQKDYREADPSLQEIEI